jgi:transcriptional regulator with XRE-family HTH domain
MKFKDYQAKLQQDPEFLKASDTLKLNFDLAKAVLRARLKKGWSQNVLAKAVGTKQANISRIETGTANPTISLVNKLAIALGLEVNIVPIGYSVLPKIDLGTIPSGSQDKILEPAWPSSECETVFVVKSTAIDNEGKFND